VPREVRHPLDAVEAARELQLQRGGLVGLVVVDVEHIAIAGERGNLTLLGPAAVACLSELDRTVRPRWVCWNNETAATLLAAELRLATCWDIAAVHRLLHSGWRAEPARVWAILHRLDHHRLPIIGQLDLLSIDEGDGGDPESPVRPDGHLRPEWLAGDWRSTVVHSAAWAATALRAAEEQRGCLQALQHEGSVMGDFESTARAESTAELLCAELAFDGLPIDRVGAEALIASLVGARPSSEAEAVTMRAERDADVLHHLPPGSGIDLRNPGDVKAMLRRLGIDVPDTRAWRLEAMRDVHPAVGALLRWRKAERIATTFGHTWLAEHVGDDGRLRGAWSASDGAAGRMTAQAGLHNLPADLRPVVVAEPGHVFVRADLGQIEPRVLAAVSGDPALRAATRENDLYAPVASRLGVERSVAKVAVLAAMYGQTSGTAGQALRGMEAAYPVAIRYLDDAARSGQEGRDLRTYGGRLIRMFDIREGSDYTAVAAARGRYARNAMVQGAAAELFKVWAVTVRARGEELDARIVLCLHDELLVHVPIANADATVALLERCLGEAAHRWHPTSNVRFVADTAIIHSWDQAK
jgi:DNA polymerase-1